MLLLFTHKNHTATLHSEPPSRSSRRLRRLGDTWCKDTNKMWNKHLFGRKNAKKSRIIWNIGKICLFLQRERRNQVEPRCEERWHLRDDEQFDLAAWFPSLIYPTVSLCGRVGFYFHVSSAIKLFLVCPACCGNEINQFDNLSTHFHFVVWMNDEL